MLIDEDIILNYFQSEGVKLYLSTTSLVSSLKYTDKRENIKNVMMSLLRKNAKY